MVQKQDNQTNSHANQKLGKLYWAVLLGLLLQIALYYFLTQYLK
jgi:hypothetical protein